MFCQCLHAGMDGKVVAGAPLLILLVVTPRAAKQHPGAQKDVPQPRHSFHTAPLKCDAFPSIFVSGTWPSHLLGERGEIKVKIQLI